MNRDSLLPTGPTGAAIAPAIAAAPGAAKRIGVAITSYTLRNGSRSPDGKFPAWKGALDVLEHCHRIGAGGLQTGVRGWQGDFARSVRDRREALGMFLEGQIGLPRMESDVARFEAEIRGAKEAGATVLRTALGGRRYEDFDSLENFRQFQERSWRALTLSEPVARRNDVRLAVENHKDWRAPELLDLVRRISSPHLGVTLDFGNSLALLEDCHEVAAALAPFAFTTHIKDMAVQTHDHGFLLSEVPLGEGLLDLKGIIARCEQANPAVQFCLEMITRDPLQVRCLERKYWATFPDLPAADLARTLALAKNSPPRQPLPRVTGKSPEERLAFEEENVVKSIAYARAQLGL